MLGTTSETRLSTCHVKLQILIREVSRRLSLRLRQKIDLTVVCGHRGEAEQNQAWRDGNSEKRWPDSRHNQTPSTAVDVAPYPLDWSNAELFMLLIGYIMAVADDLGIEIEVGALWKKKDRPHIQLTETELAKAA